MNYRPLFFPLQLGVNIFRISVNKGHVYCFVLAWAVVALFVPEVQPLIVFNFFIAFLYFSF